MVPQIKYSKENICISNHITNGIILNKFLIFNDKLIVSDSPTEEDILNSFHESEQVGNCMSNIENEVL